MKASKFMALITVFVMAVMVLCISQSIIINPEPILADIKDDSGYYRLHKRVYHCICDGTESYCSPCVEDEHIPEV